MLISELIIDDLVYVHKPTILCFCPQLRQDATFDEFIKGHKYTPVCDTCFVKLG